MIRYRYLAILISLAVILMSCKLAQPEGVQPAELANATSSSPDTDFPTEKATETELEDPNVTQAVKEDNPLSETREKPPQSQAAEIRPIELRAELTHLSNLMGYQVVDENGDKLGVISDYIVNTCETYIIYMLMEPTADLDVAPGEKVLIPFEVVTINSGVIDAQNKTIQVRLIPEQFSGAPTLPADKQLTPTDWENSVRTFWQKWARIGMLATSCNVPGGPVYKVAYASQLLKVELYDGLGNLLGVVQEAILEPESGKLAFYIVKPSKGDGLVLAHLRAINIPKEALLPGGVLTLVLTADPQVFWDAPRITSIEEADDIALQSKVRQYWSR